MGNNRAEVEYIKVLNVPAHVDSKEAREKNASGYYSGSGKHGYFIKGKKVSEQKFNSEFPIVPLTPNINQYGGSLDGRHIEKH